MEAETTVVHITFRPEIINLPDDLLLRRAYSVKKTGWCCYAALLLRKAHLSSDRDERIVLTLYSDGTVCYDFHFFKTIAQSCFSLPQVNHFNQCHRRSSVLDHNVVFGTDDRCFSVGWDKMHLYCR